MEEGTCASGNQQPIASSSYSNAGGGNPHRKSELKVNKVPRLELLLEGGILFPSSSPPPRPPPRPPTWDEGRLWLGSHSVPGVGEGPFWDRIHTEEVELEVELVPGEGSEDIGTRWESRNPVHLFHYIKTRLPILLRPVRVARFVTCRYNGTTDNLVHILDTL